MKMLKTLYKTSSTTGAKQIMEIWSNDNTFTVRWGQLEGKMQEKVTECFEKNVGKTNYITPNEQAIKEAEAYHVRKVKSGYSTDITAIETVKLPMKVKTYTDHKNKIIFPCYVSPKLNGVNGTYRMTNGSMELLSRGGENYQLLEQHVSDVFEIMRELNTDEVNGEVYMHGASLQIITSAVKKYKDSTRGLEFHIFDIPNLEGDYSVRLEAMQKLKEYDFVKVIEVITANTHEELDALHDEYVADGYEGIVIRNAKGLYKHNTRSSDVIKLKKAIDAEFEIVGFNIDKNKEVVWIMNTDIGTEFKATPKGDRAYRQQLAIDGDKHIGKHWTVEFETWSDGDKPKPLKPVALYERKVDNNGEPLE